MWVLLLHLQENFHPHLDFGEQTSLCFLLLLHFSNYADEHENRDNNDSQSNF